MSNNIYKEMGISDAWPASRVHRADSAVIDAYCAVFPDVPDKARRLTEAFSPHLLENCRMADVLYYRYEIQFLREAAA